MLCNSNPYSDLSLERKGYMVSIDDVSNIVLVVAFVDVLVKV